MLQELKARGVDAVMVMVIDRAGSKSTGIPRSAPMVSGDPSTTQLIDSRGDPGGTSPRISDWRRCSPATAAAVEGDVPKLLRSP